MRITQVPQKSVMVSTIDPRMTIRRRPIVIIYLNRLQVDPRAHSPTFATEYVSSLICEKHDL
jgi:S-adenosylmethionine hydrolase